MGLFDGLKKKISEEIQTKVNQLVTTTYGGDFRKAFDHYDKLNTQNGRVASDSIVKMLEDAGVQERALAGHGKMAGGIIEEFDKSGDKEISWEEFQAVFKDAGA